MYDIVNKAQNLTLPVVAVDITSINRANDRVFNKIDNFYTPYTKNNTTNVKMPIPVDITVNMSILGRYMQDIDQILSNFIPYSNPYIILSWKEPSEVSDQIVEIRSEVLWNGNITFNSPTDTTYNDKFRVVCDTSFTIKGWIFKNKNEISAPIYFIDVNTYAINRTNILTYDSLSGLDLDNVKDSYRLSATPTFTNLFYQPARDNTYIPITENYTFNKIWEFNTIIDATITDFSATTIPANDITISWLNTLPVGSTPSTVVASDEATSFTYTNDSLLETPITTYIPDNYNFVLNTQSPFTNTFVFYGTNFTRTDIVLLSSNNINITGNLPLSTIESKYTGTATGFVLPVSSYKILTDGVMTVEIPYLSGSGGVDIIVSNPAGWVTSNSLSGFTFVVP